MIFFCPSDRSRQSITEKEREIGVYLLTCSLSLCLSFYFETMISNCIDQSWKFSDILNVPTRNDIRSSLIKTKFFVFFCFIVRLLDVKKTSDENRSSSWRFDELDARRRKWKGKNISGCFCFASSSRISLNSRNSDESCSKQKFIVIEFSIRNKSKTKKTVDFFSLFLKRFSRSMKKTDYSTSIDKSDYFFDRKRKFFRW